MLAPTPPGIIAFKNELSKFETSKGTVQFPIDGPLPFTLIGHIVNFRVLENQEKSKVKSKKQSKQKPCVEIFSSRGAKATGPAERNTFVKFGILSLAPPAVRRSAK